MSELTTNTTNNETINHRGFRFGFKFENRNSKLFYYCTMILFVYLADSIMAYTTPSYLENHLSSTALMGIVFATSSLVGFVVDFLMGELFPDKNHKFFLKWSIILAIGFPLGFLLFPANILTFLLGLAIWGIYYEFISFSNSQYVAHQSDRGNHETIWGVMFFFRAVSLTFGPIVAATLIDISYNASFITALGFLLIALILFIFDKEKNTKSINVERSYESVSVVKELRIWTIFTKRIWLLLLFCFGIVFIDAAFWSIGTILSEKLHTENGGIPGLILVLYSLPMFFMGFFAKRIARPYGKKKAAFITGLIGSVFLILVGFTTDYGLISLFVFIFACFFAMTAPEIKGVFADFDSRMHKSRNSLIGLESGIYSAGYIVGPIICGFLADRFGIQMTFSILGIGMVFIILLCLLRVPRKTKMPRSELEMLEMD